MLAFSRVCRQSFTVKGITFALLGIYTWGAYHHINQAYHPVAYTLMVGLWLMDATVYYQEWKLTMSMQHPAPPQSTRDQVIEPVTWWRSFFSLELFFFYVAALLSVYIIGRVFIS